MRLGILADIHGRIENLQRAIAILERERVDQFVLLGDVIDERSHADETVKMVKDCGAVGVWGNHELGLCVDVEDEIRELYSRPVVEFFGTLTSHLEFGDVLFSHTLPHHDATDPMSYYVGEQALDAGEIDEAFSRCSPRVLMMGHFHRWFAATSAGRIAWDGREPLQLDAELRYLFVIAAVMYGWAAIFDQEENQLIPIRL
jgi:predicted phosphodiesterase